MEKVIARRELNKEFFPYDEAVCDDYVTQ